MAEVIETIKFKNTGEHSWQAPSDAELINVLIVAGGGGGGAGGRNPGGGGGGAGGIILLEEKEVTPGETYNIFVGAGGSGGNSSQDSGYQGQDSYFDTFTAIGGGGGKASRGSLTRSDGGSGGGGTATFGGNSYAYGGSGVEGQGHDGGDGDSGNDNGGGGGGAGEPGIDATGSKAGDGGDGIEFPANSGEYYGGGGGGASRNGAEEGYGGLGGGAKGGNLDTISAGENATDNTGGGGGGSAETDPGGNGGSGIVIIQILQTALYQADTRRNLTGQITQNADTQRILSSKKTYIFDSLRNLEELVELSFDTTRILGFEMEPELFDTLRLLHKFKNLQWSQNRYKNLVFPPKYWSFSEEFYDQFIQGDHYVTKAYDDRNDYLGLTDDYDFNFGPKEIGQPLPESEYNHKEIGEHDIYYKTIGYGNHYWDPETLWGVYAQTAGEIYLIQPNEDFTDLLRHEQLVFSPSGSIHPSIAFDKSGQYTITVELIPALNGYVYEEDDYADYQPEIWIMEYPYQENDIRRIAYGRRPRVRMNHGNNLIIFYMDKYGEKIFYRLEEENYETEHEVTNVYIPDRKMEMTDIAILFEQTTNLYDDIIEDYLKEYSGKVIVFYDREDDWRPHKYTLSEEVKYYPYDIFWDTEPVEPTEVQARLEGLEWEDIRVLIKILSLNNRTGQPVEEENHITILEHRDHEELTFYPDSDSKSEIRILPYNTVYDVRQYIDNEEYDDWGIIISPDTTEDGDSFNLPFLLDQNRRKDTQSVNITLNNEWEELLFEAHMTLVDMNDQPIEYAKIFIEPQRDFEGISRTTNSNGVAHFENSIIPYDTPYSLRIEHPTLGTLDVWGVILHEDYQDDFFYMDIKLWWLDELVDTQNAETSIVALDWVDTRYNVTFTVYDNQNNLLENATITIHEKIDQEEVVLTTDINGQADTILVPYSTPYDVTVEHNSIVDTNWGILIWNNDDTRQMDIDLKVLDGINERQDTQQAETMLVSVLWVEV